MRPKTWLSLLAICLTAGGARAQAPDPARNAAKQDARPVAADSRTWSNVVQGFGETWESAKQNGLREAEQSVAAHLRELEPTLDWVPAAEDLRRWGMVKEVKHEVVESPRLGRHHRVELLVEVTDRNIQEIRARDRDERALGRHLLSAKLLAALVGLLAAIAGFVRLEELTRGYYSGLLRLLLLLSVGLVAAGLWLVL